MKKKIAIALAVLLLLMLAGCGGEAEPDPHEGLWVGAYLESEGYKLLVGEGEGLTCDLLLEGGGKATFHWYDEEDGWQDVDARWTIEGENLTVKSRDPILSGTFTGTFDGDALYLTDFPGTDFGFAMGREESQTLEDLRAESDI